MKFMNDLTPNPHMDSSKSHKDIKHTSQSTFMLETLPSRLQAFVITPLRIEIHFHADQALHSMSFAFFIHQPKNNASSKAKTMREEDEYNTQQACILVLLPGLLHVQTVTMQDNYASSSRKRTDQNVSILCLDLNTSLFFQHVSLLFPALQPKISAHG